MNIGKIHWKLCQHREFKKSNCMRTSQHDYVKVHGTFNVTPMGNLGNSSQGSFRFGWATRISRCGGTVRDGPKPEASINLKFCCEGAGAGERYILEVPGFEPRKTDFSDICMGKGGSVGRALFLFGVIVFIQSAAGIGLTGNGTLSNGSPTCPNFWRSMAKWNN